MYARTLSSDRRGNVEAERKREEEEEGEEEEEEEEESKCLLPFLFYDRRRGLL